MKEVDQLSNPDRYIKLAKILRIGNAAVARAQAENRAFGLPEVFVKAGRLYYLLPSGEVTTERPAVLGAT